MSEMVSLSTVLPEHRIGVEDLRQHVARSLSPRLATRLARSADHSWSESRHLVVPLRELGRLASLDDRNRLYATHALRLGEAAARKAIADAGVSVSEITTIVGVSSTGFLMPTLDTRLMEAIGLSPRCRRVPLMHLGCAGGASALGLARRLAERDAEVVLVVSVEIPSLSLPTWEPSTTDLFASLQFGDAASAAVVTGDTRGLGPEIVDAESLHFTGTLEDDGVDLTSMGLRLKRPHGLASLLRDGVGEAVDGLLARHGRTRDDVDFWVVHPRNAELLEAAATGLGLADDAVGASRRVWRRAGNVVSSGVFLVLDELRRTGAPKDGASGVVLAYGAGFGCEALLLRSAGWLAGRSRERGDMVDDSRV